MLLIVVIVSEVVVIIVTLAAVMVAALCDREFRESILPDQRPWTSTQLRRVVLRW